MHESHCANVVDVYLDFEDDDECLAIELDGEDGGGEEELADHGLSLF
jgi:succinyl-CoA synthetase alpha subunit